MIIVMGCYRTGTSAVAGILHHLGVNMGSNFQEPNVGNPKGYFEDPDFIKINRRLYETKGTIGSKDEFHELCYNKTLTGGNLWGFKDPRFCLVAQHVMCKHPFCSNENAQIIWIHRDVDETVMSIIKALGLNGLDADPNKWRTFVQHYVNETSNYMSMHDATKVLDINFPDLMANPCANVTKIANFINVPFVDAAFNFMGVIR